MSTYVVGNGRAPVIEYKPGTAQQSDLGDDSVPVRERRQRAERMRGDAARHRARAVELAAANISDGSAEEQHLSRLADLYGRAYDELACAASARAEVGCHDRDSFPWIAAVNRSFAATRRAEAYLERAGTVSALQRGDERAVALHERAEIEAERRARRGRVGGL